jgi:hypothetical protein
MTLSWLVNTYPLPALFRHWGIVTPADTFVKVDVEAFECTLVPSWLDWLGRLGRGNKPGFIISFHNYVNNCTDAQYDDISRFAGLYKSVWRRHPGRGIENALKLWTPVPPSKIPLAFGGGVGKTVHHGAT